LTKIRKRFRVKLAALTIEYWVGNPENPERRKENGRGDYDKV
jgi:hypothetical protein